MNLLSVRNLTAQLKIDKKIYTVVNELSFDLYSGKTLAIVGESGSGKSLTALSILRILPEPPALPPTGVVLFENKNLLLLSEKEMRRYRGGKIAIIFQDPRRSFNPVYTVGYQIQEVVETHLGLKKEAAIEKTVQLLKDVSLPDPEKRRVEYPHQMSGGMLQRAAIAMAIAGEPQILIADEPTTALDMTTQKEILLLLKELQKKKGMALLLITHDMGVVSEMADQVLVLYASEKMEAGDVKNLFETPSHPYTAALFALKKRGKFQTIQGSIPTIDNFPKGCHFAPRCPHALPECIDQKPSEYKIGLNHTVKCFLFKNHSS